MTKILTFYYWTVSSLWENWGRVSAASGDYYKIKLLDEPVWTVLVVSGSLSLPLPLSPSHLLVFPLIPQMHGGEVWARDIQRDWEWEREREKGAGRELGGNWEGTGRDCGWGSLGSEKRAESCGAATETGVKHWWRTRGGEVTGPSFISTSWTHGFISLFEDRLIGLDAAGELKSHYHWQNRQDRQSQWSWVHLHLHVHHVRPTGSRPPLFVSDTGFGPESGFVPGRLHPPVPGEEAVSDGGEQWWRKEYK